MEQKYLQIQDQIPDALKSQMPQWREDGRILQINEIFYSIEGEGQRVGQPTIFVRLAKCNLRCFFCDTEFDASTEMTIETIFKKVKIHPAIWVCLTGGEPLGQNITSLCHLLKEKVYRIQIETNGTIHPDPELYNLIEHWTVSPKRRIISSGLTRITELKYVVGKMFREDIVEEDRADHIYLQPESSEPRYNQKVFEILMRHPKWRLSCIIHKILELP